jgi:hypothetical protein
MKTRPIPIRLDARTIMALDEKALLLGIPRSSIMKLAIRVQLPLLDRGLLRAEKAKA